MRRRLPFLFRITTIFGCFFQPLSAGIIETTPEVKWEFAVTAIFRDEACYLREWIEFYKLTGAEHFFLYNHQSTDDYLEVLQPYIEKGEVELFDWCYAFNSQDLTGWHAIQWNAYRDAVKRAKGRVDWLAIVDTDEFLFSPDGKRIQDCLRPLLNNKQVCIGGILVKWLMFGTSNVEKVPDDQTLIETLTMCNGVLEKSSKTICRPDKVEDIYSSHSCIYITGYEGVEVDQLPEQEKLQLNHYWTRDKNFFKNVKLARRENWGWRQGILQKMASSYNRVPDSAILQYVPALRKNLGLAPKKSIFD